MKYIISESKIESIIMDFLDSNYVPDYGWETMGHYESDSKKYGYVHFPINDIHTYFYLYGANEYNNNLPKTIFIHGWVGDVLNDYFGDMWKPVFVKWFEKNTGMSVEHITIGGDK